MRRFFLFALIAVTLFPGSAATQILEYEIIDRFRYSGCNEYDIQEVAALEEENELIYVAWCAALDNYLMVIRCKEDICRILDKTGGEDRDTR